MCDAETSDDLGRIVEVFMKMDKRILWVGSAGLAGALSAYVAKNRNTSRLKNRDLSSSYLEVPLKKQMSSLLI